MLIKIGVGIQNYFPVFFSFDLYYPHIQNWRYCTFLYHKHHLSCMNNNEQCPERKSFSFLISHFSSSKKKCLSLSRSLSKMCICVYICVCIYACVYIPYTHIHAYLGTRITYSST